ncbi:acyl-CoA N-acyltransferase [Calocera viscosa TUFC12733]|uniref:Acyl-CoA N-acyltransferase n=1 Tax=Calocera viscosa (strain TUFC12733) TaxID=1330018 RepID=A0A167MVC5_CALVF|nr:acyl-CoA N-acyltransferase [Calocera viscosa TUFC12733]
MTEPLPYMIVHATQADIPALSQIFPYVIVHATQADIPALSQIFLESIDTTVPGKTFSDQPGYTLEKVEAALSKRLLPEDGSVTTFVAVHPGTGELLGYVNVKEHGGPVLGGDYESTSDVQTPEDPPEMDHLFTKVPKEGGSGKGVGSALLKRVLQEEKWAKRGIRVICFERNERALSFYRKWGFEQVGKLHNAGDWEDKETALVLWLKATPQ